MNVYQANIPLATFHTADVRSIQIARKRQRFLGQLPPFSEFTQPISECFLNPQLVVGIHRSNETIFDDHKSTDFKYHLMKLHIEYEQQAEYSLERRETGKLDWRVEKMALSKDKTQLKYNDFLTLSGIPAEAQEYRLGNRSALEWVVDQYRVSTDARSGIVNDPNREDDPEYIVRLVGQVVTVSVETVKLVRELAGLSIDQA